MSELGLLDCRFGLTTLTCVLRPSLIRLKDLFEYRSHLVCDIREADDAARSRLLGLPKLEPLLDIRALIGQHCQGIPATLGDRSELLLDDDARGFFDGFEFKDLEVMMLKRTTELPPVRSSDANH